MKKICIVLMVLSSFFIFSQQKGGCYKALCVESKRVFTQTVPVHIASHLDADISQLLILYIPQTPTFQKDSRLRFGLKKHFLTQNFQLS